MSPRADARRARHTIRESTPPLAGEPPFELSPKAVPEIERVVVLDVLILPPDPSSTSRPCSVKAPCAHRTGCRSGGSVAAPSSHHAGLLLRRTGVPRASRPQEAGRSETTAAEIEWPARLPSIGKVQTPSALSDPRAKVPIVQTLSAQSRRRPDRTPSSRTDSFSQSRARNGR